MVWQTQMPQMCWKRKAMKNISLQMGATKNPAVYGRGGQWNIFMVYFLKRWCCLHSPRQQLDSVPKFSASLICLAYVWIYIIFNAVLDNNVYPSSQYMCERYTYTGISIVGRGRWKYITWRVGSGEKNAEGGGGSTKNFGHKNFPMAQRVLKALVY